MTPDKTVSAQCNAGQKCVSSLLTRLHVTSESQKKPEQGQRVEDTQQVHIVQSQGRSHNNHTQMQLCCTRKHDRLFFHASLFPTRKNRVGIPPNHIRISSQGEEGEGLICVHPTFHGWKRSRNVPSHSLLCVRIKNGPSSSSAPFLAVPPSIFSTISLASVASPLLLLSSSGCSSMP